MAMSAESKTAILSAKSKNPLTSMTAKSKKPMITDVRGSTQERVYTTIRGVLNCASYD